ncbi:hypothetical protein [Corynebacterium variabile]|nr:hypothetical protein [Corynebacterium variabile]
MSAGYTPSAELLDAAHRLAETAPPLTDAVADRVVTILTAGGGRR